MIVDLWQDLRFGARMLMKQPGFTLSCRRHACARHWREYGCSSASINAVLLRPLPYRKRRWGCKVLGNLLALGMTEGMGARAGGV